MLKVLNLLIYYPINSICKCILEVFVVDRQIRRILKGKLAKTYLKKYVKKIIKTPYSNIEREDKNPIIWQYWEQGYENAPQIVKECIKSVQEHKNGCDYVFLDSNDLTNYIEIPQYLIEMKNKGVIKSAHFSDYIRTCLLEKYGGIWVDSTILFTENLPKYITETEFFVFQNDLKIDLDGLNHANYLIAAKPHNKLMQKMKCFLELYWKENCFVWNYFFYLHALTMFTQMDKEIKKMFLKVPFASFIPVQRFQKELMNPYSEERFEQIKKNCSIHKLSYKQHVLNKKQKNLSGTFLEKLLDGSLINE